MAGGTNSATVTRENDAIRNGTLNAKNSSGKDESVETSTDEVSAVVKFLAGAELFHEDENKEWKLRGKGQFQILFDRENKTYQVEMKRDTDNSLCAKHRITKAIQLIPVRGSDRSYAWSAMDSSDKESSPVSMVFSVRFKNREMADNFQEEFQKAQTPAEDTKRPEGKGKRKIKGKRENSKEKIGANKGKKKTRKDKGTRNTEINRSGGCAESIFSAPAELFYEDENKEWKLRGKGHFQILFDRENKTYLVEMKRDTNNSLCAKHRITKAIQLVPVRGSDRSYAWPAMDSSDKESSPVSMVFSVRFKDKEMADNFQEEFQKATQARIKEEAKSKEEKFGRQKGQERLKQILRFWHR